MITIPKIQISELVSESFLIQIYEPSKVNGNIKPIETIVIAILIRLRNPIALLEIGTFDGKTTLNMAANCSEEAKVYTLDLPKEQVNSTKLPLAPGEKIYINKETSGSKYLGTNYEMKITQLYGDSATFDFSPFLNMMDFIFVDGSHSFEYVLSDSEKAIEMLKNGRGAIVWHDYGSWGGVKKALNKLYIKDSRFKGLRHIDGTSLVCLIA